MKVTVVAGNPKPGSRTLNAAVLLSNLIAGRDPDHVIDVTALGVGLLGWGDAAVSASVETVAASDLVVVASPTFKAAYTGLLKLFLDQFATGNGMKGVTAVPLMLGAGPAHFLAPELLLKPVLVELGATVPCQGLYVNDKTFDDPAAYQGWLDQWGEIVRRNAGLTHES